MTDRPAVSSDRAVAFGPFRLLPAQQLLLENENPVRLGSRAFEILAALLEHPGEVVGKNELIARVWPNTHIDENTLRVHVAGLRKALGDGQPGRRYLASVPGRGYRFVAPVELAAPGVSATPPDARVDRVHNIPVSQVRALGRADTIRALRDQLPKQRFMTIVGAGGIGKTTVAIAVAESLLSSYEHGVCFVDLAPLSEPRLTPAAIVSALKLAIHYEDPVPALLAFLRDKQMLIVLDSSEHVVETTAPLVEQILASAPGVHIMATSREPLRAEGERIHRLQPLETPMNSSEVSAAAALTFPAVQLFVERATAILDGFALSDADAPILCDICRRLGGNALAIELAAARTDAFGIRQLAVMLDDRFRILNLGKRTAQARHRSLAAALDWSYDFLYEAERVILRRLSVFAGAFTLDAANAVAGDANTPIVDGLANLVTKSLVSADISGSIVQYRLLDTTRAYAAQKLAETGDREAYARRHAEYHLDWFWSAAAELEIRTPSEWRENYARGLDDARTALTWAFSSSGDRTLGIALTLASISFWLQLSFLPELREWLERALASLSAQPNPTDADELKLRVTLSLIMPHATQFVPETDDFDAKTLALAERLGDLGAQGQILYQWSTHCLYAGKYRETLAVAEQCCAIAARSRSALHEIMGHGMVALALHYIGNNEQALGHIKPILEQDIAPNQLALFSNQLTARATFSEILWIRGLPDQAMENALLTLQQARTIGNPQLISSILSRTVCPIAIERGDLEEAESLVEMLLDSTAKAGLNTRHASGRSLKGTLLVKNGDFSGLEMQRSALRWLREVNFFFRYPISLGALAQGLGDAGKSAEGLRIIDEALERADGFEERWCLPELLRLKGEVLRLERAKQGAAEECFQQSLDWARRQGALSWELRTATSLAKLWRDDGRKAEAKAVLSVVYDRFTEGFETADLEIARALIDELS